MRGSRTHAWSPARHAWRSAVGHRRGQAVALVAISALVTASAAFAPVYDRAMQQALVDTLLGRATPADASVVVVSESEDFLGSVDGARDPRELGSLIAREVGADQLGPTVLGRAAIVTPTDGAVPPSGLLLWRDGACAHVRVVAGACPGAAGEIMVSEADVENFDLRPGDRVRIPSEVEGEDGELVTVPLRVVGTYAPLEDAWWQGQRTVGISGVVLGLDPSANHDAWLTTEETFGEAPLLTAETSQAGAPVRTDDADVDGLLDLADGIGTLSGALDLQGGLSIRTGVVALADDVRTQVAQAHRTVPLLMAPMAVLSVFVLWLVLSAATAARRGEVAVARLRGRSPAGAAGLLLLELLPVLLVGVIPGVAIAWVGGEVVRRLLPGAPPAEVAPGAGIAVLGAAVALVLLALAAAVRTAREKLHDVVRSGPPASGRWALGAVDAFVVASVGTGVLAFATGSLQGPFALAGPALVALLTGLVLAHLAAPLARVLGRRLLGRGRLVAGTSLLATGRRSEPRTVIVVIAVACALAVFSIDALAIGERNRSNASRHDAGAPVVLDLTGRDLDAVREALRGADPEGRRTTPVVVSPDTLAVEPEAFRRIAMFPRGAPTSAQWQALAGPDVEPVELTGTRFSLSVRPDPQLQARDAFATDIDVRISLVVTSGTGVRRTIELGTLPPAGRRRTLVGTEPACATGCLLSAVRFTAPLGITIRGEVDLGDLRVDRRPVVWGAGPTAWNTTATDNTTIFPSADAPEDVLRLVVSTDGEYPAEISAAWVPSALPVLLSEDQEIDPEGLEVNGVDGDDRIAKAVGRVPLVPAMSGDAALADLDAITRGSAVTFDARLEVWLDDDPELEDAVRAALRDRDVEVVDTRRYSEVRQAYDDTVASWSLSLGAAVAPAVLLLALLVLMILAVIGWRGRARELAILRLNGASRRTTRRLAVWAELPAVLLAVAGGTAAGLAGAALAMPDVPFFPSPPEDPVVDLATSWPAVGAVTAVCVVVLPVVAALTGVAVARRAHVERVREGG